MSRTARTASKPVKVVLGVLGGLVVLVALVAVATAGGRTEAENNLIDGLRAVNPALVADENAAIQHAKNVCAAPDQQPVPQLAITRTEFGVTDDPTAVKIVSVIRSSKICP